jgi:putative SOS response-associated peptidase YedK
MCTNFTPTRHQQWITDHFGVGLPEQPFPLETYPGYAAPIAVLGEQQKPEMHLARFGLIPHWANDAKAATQIGRKTYNARSETVADKPSYRTAWRKRQFAIALLDDFFELNWETGKAVRWRIRRTDGQPMGVASIWDRWLDTSTGELVTSFSMLTVNADGHPVMGRFHRPGDEKRSVVVMEPRQFGAWLHADLDPADLCTVPAHAVLTAEPAPPVEPRAVLRPEQSVHAATVNSQPSLF